MTDLNDRVEKINQFFIDMRVTTLNGEKFIYVVVQFPSKWEIDEDTPNKFNVSVAKDSKNEGQYLFCAELSVGFDKIFDAIDYNISKMKTAQERAKLLKEKIEDLQNLFYDETIPIESLRTLDFSYRGKKKTNKQILVPETNVEQNTENNNDITNSNDE